MTTRNGGRIMWTRMTRRTKRTGRPTGVAIDDVDFLAISTRIEPVGPMPALTSRVPLATPNGQVETARLHRGDLVMTDTGDCVPILRKVSRTVPARGSFRPVRLRAPYFGLQRDIVVAPQQQA